MVLSARAFAYRHCSNLLFINLKLCTSASSDEAVFLCLKYFKTPLSPPPLVLLLPPVLGDCTGAGDGQGATRPGDKAQAEGEVGFFRGNNFELVSCDAFLLAAGQVLMVI